MEVQSAIVFDDGAFQVNIRHAAKDLGLCRRLDAAARDLHLDILQFIHPATGKNMKFERMPEEEIFLPFFGSGI